MLQEEEMKYDFIIQMALFNQKEEWIKTKPRFNLSLIG